MTERHQARLRRRLLRILSILALLTLAIVLLAVVGLFTYQPSPAEGFGFSSAGKTLRLSDGRTLAYLESGDPEGRPVFHFHGGPGSRLAALRFEELNRRLGIRMIVPDRPGYGLSDLQKNRTYLDWPEDVGELANHLGIDRFAVLGWSSGGPHAAAAAYAMPERITVAAIAAGEGPYSSADFPPGVLSGDTFSGSRINRLSIWSASNGPWLIEALSRMMRIAIFSDPVGLAESFGDTSLSARDRQFFERREYAAELVEAFRQGAEGITRDLTIERRDWPFELEEIHAPEVLVFHGEEDAGVDPRVAHYLCGRIQSCDEPTIYPGEGHSVVYYRYEEIIEGMLDTWE